MSTTKDSIGYPYDWADPAHTHTISLPQMAQDNPWANGHYALTAICWGAIFMLLISLGVFP